MVNGNAKIVNDCLDAGLLGISKPNELKQVSLPFDHGANGMDRGQKKLFIAVRLDPDAEFVKAKIIGINAAVHVKA